MKIPTPGFRPFVTRFALLCGLLALAFGLELRAQTAAGGIEGRVFNAATGSYLEGARLTIEGTPLETFSDPDGTYRFANVPIGPSPS